MKTFLKIILNLIVFVAFLFFCQGLIDTYKQIIDGFRIAKIVAPIQSPQLELFPLEEDKKEEVLSILDQEFVYLDKGNQAYVFETKDQKYVIKILRCHRFQPSLWTKLPFLPSFFNEKRWEKIEQKRFRRIYWLGSFCLAYHELKEPSEFLYLHVRKTSHLKKRLKVTDKIGRKHYIDLDNVFFMLQKKAKDFQEHIMELKSQEDKEALKQVISSFIETVSHRCRKGIQNRSRGYLKNLGYLNGRVIEFDVGEFIKNPKLQDIHGIQYEAARFTGHFRDFLLEELPDLVEYFDDEFRRQLTDI